MTTEDKLRHKKSVFDALLETKREEFERLSNFQQEQLESINRSSNNESQDVIENPRENQMRELRVENETIDKLRKEINYLEGFESLKERDQVEVGSLIKTSAGNFLVAVPKLKFEAEGDTFTAISAHSPLFEALSGAAEGDKVDFNGEQYHIETII